MYAERIFVCLNNILSVKNFQRTITNFQHTSKKVRNARRTKFFTLRVNRALSLQINAEFLPQFSNDKSKTETSYLHSQAMRFENRYPANCGRKNLNTKINTDKEVF